MLLAIFVVMSFQAFGAIETHQFDNEVQRKRYQSFIEEMRCPKCQNQNLAGSDSPISADLRRELYDMINAGKSDQEIVDFMVARYGDFILYRPRVTPATYALWIAPTILLIAGVVVLILMLHKRRRLAITQTTGELSTAEQSRLTSLLNTHARDNHARAATVNEKIDNNKKTEEPR
ncbi:MAG: cytochrome c-type biogenesis protein CcmH [Moraxellaceae bacterium]|nr:MAG: cytochrome c-type biogenesis protein CcmH [Moraxellaceae bacterium]